jgi:3-hydroxybutyryl-CoA dehydratase
VKTFAVGDTASFSRTVTAADIEAFAAVSGDTNPVHLDDAYAARTRFGRRIAHGALVASYVSNVIGNQLPGEGTIYLSSSLRFLKPTFVGDTVTATATVKAAREEKSIYTLEVAVTNQRGEAVCAGEAVVLYDPVKD